MSNKTEDVNKLIVATEKIVEIAANSPELREAGKRLSKSALTITKAIETVLLPIAAVNFAFEGAKKYFNETFPDDISQATRNIPPELLTKPKASIAAPVLQGLAFSHEEPSLKVMYINLLRSSMDGRKTGSVHPAHAEIIRQLSSDEAQLLDSIMKSNIPTSVPLPIVSLLQQQPKDTYGHRIKNIIAIKNAENREVSFFLSIAAMLDNFVRLGLVSIDYTNHLVSEDRYVWVETHPVYLEMKNKWGKDLEIGKGILEITGFGKTFSDAVISDEHSNN